MFACICNAVTDEQVIGAIDQGAETVEAIGTATKAGTCCGCCRDHLEDLIVERRYARPQAAGDPRTRFACSQPASQGRTFLPLADRAEVR